MQQDSSLSLGGNLEVNISTVKFILAIEQNVRNPLNFLSLFKIETQIYGAILGC